jgi:hypothetical protein
VNNFVYGPNLATKWTLIIKFIDLFDGPGGKMSVSINAPSNSLARRLTSSSLAMAAFALTAFTAFSPATSFGQETPVANPDSEVARSLKRKTVIGKIRDAVASLDVSLKADLLEAEIFEGVNAALRYRYEFEPSYKGDYHLRMDRWTLDTDVNVGDMVKQAARDFKIGLNLKRGTEVLFVRAFKQKSEAIRAIPYPFWNLPFNAEDISEKLEIGDFVSFTAAMNVVVSASTLPLSVNPVQLSTHYLVSGDFQVHLFRKNKDQVVLKLIALRKKEKAFSVSAGLASGYKILGLRVVDRRIESWTNFSEMFKLSESSTKSNLLMVDYMLDLRDSRVRNAYDGLISSMYELNTELTDKLISDITPFETIYATERLRANNLRTIDRNFKGKNDVDENSKTGFRFGAFLFRFARDVEYTENALTSVDQNEVTNYFRLHTFQRTTTNSLWFSYYKSEGVSRSSLLFEADKDLKIKSVKDIVFEWDYRDKSLEEDEFMMIQNAVKQAVPPSVYGKINWGDWTTNREYGNARFLYRMVLSPKALTSVTGMDFGRIFERLNAYLLTIPEPTSESIDPFKDDEMRRQMRQTILDKYKFDLLNIAHWMSQVFDLTKTHEERAKAFAELRFNHLFIEIGPGFMVSLLPQADLQNYVYFNIVLTADHMKPMPFEYGKVPDRKLYEAAAYIRAVLDSRDADLVIQLAK